MYTWANVHTAVLSKCTHIFTVLFVRLIKHPWSSPKKLPVSTLPKVESIHIPEFAQDYKSGLRSDRGPVRSSSMRFFEVAILKITIRVFKCVLNLVWEILPIQPTVLEYNPGHDTLATKKVSKYLRDAKTLDVLNLVPRYLLRQAYLASQTQKCT